MTAISPTSAASAAATTTANTTAASAAPLAVARITAPLMCVVDMVWPDQSNHHGTLFGGAALSALDRLAFIAASKLLRGTVVTAAVSRLDFLAPAPAGHLMECQAQVLRQGRRSVTLQTELYAEDLLSGERTLCLSGDFVMVRKEAEAGGAPGLVAAAAGVADPAPAAQPPAHPEVQVAEIVFPGHANHRGIVHGGPVMEWLVKAGFVAATRSLRKAMVLGRTERMDFVAPARVGDIAEVVAQVVRVGTRSVTVQVALWAEDPLNGERRLCTTSSLVYVAIADE